MWANASEQGDKNCFNSKYVRLLCLLCRFVCIWTFFFSLNFFIVHFCVVRFVELNTNLKSNDSFVCLSTNSSLARLYLFSTRQQNSYFSLFKICLFFRLIIKQYEKNRSQWRRRFNEINSRHRKQPNEVNEKCPSFVSDFQEWKDKKMAMKLTTLNTRRWWAFAECNDAFVGLRATLFIFISDSHFVFIIFVSLHSSSLKGNDIFFA